MPAGFPGTSCCLERSFFSRKVSQIRVRGCEGRGSEGWAPGPPRLLLPAPPGPWDRVCQAGGCVMSSSSQCTRSSRASRALGLRCLVRPGWAQPSGRYAGHGSPGRCQGLSGPTPGLWASCHPAPGAPSQDPLRARATGLPAQDKGLPEAKLREGGSSRRESGLAPSPRDGERGAPPALTPQAPVPGLGVLVLWLEGPQFWARAGAGRAVLGSARAAPSTSSPPGPDAQCPLDVRRFASPASI